MEKVNKKTKKKNVKRLHTTFYTHQENRSATSHMGPFVDDQLKMKQAYAWTALADTIWLLTVWRCHFSWLFSSSSHSHKTCKNEKSGLTHEQGNCHIADQLNVRKQTEFKPHLLAKTASLSVKRKDTTYFRTLVQVKYSINVNHTGSWSLKDCTYCLVLHAEVTSRWVLYSFCREASPTIVRPAMDASFLEHLRVRKTTISCRVGQSQHVGTKESNHRHSRCAHRFFFSPESGQPSHPIDVCLDAAFPLKQGRGEAPKLHLSPPSFKVCQDHCRPPSATRVQPANRAKQGTSPLEAHAVVCVRAYIFAPASAHTTLHTIQKARLSLRRWLCLRAFEWLLIFALPKSLCKWRDHFVSIFPFSFCHDVLTQSYGVCRSWASRFFFGPTNLKTKNCVKGSFAAVLDHSRSYVWGKCIMERLGGGTPAEQAQAFLDMSPSKLGQYARLWEFCRL